MNPIQPVPSGAFPNPAAPRAKRSPLKTLLFVGLGLVGAFIGLCVLLAIISPSDPAAAAKEAAQAKESARALSAYAGMWQGQDGTTIAIRGDGGADFNMGNTSVTGGKAALDEAAKKLKVNGLFGIGREWTVDAAPHEANGATEMTLNNIVYRRSGGFTPSPPSGGAADNSRGSGENEPGRTGAFPQEEAAALVKETLLDFNTAVQKRDFTDFQRHADAKMQSSVTPDKYLAAFQNFIDQKIDFGVIATLTPAFTDGPTVDENGLLNIKGEYATTPSKVRFDLQYIREGGVWKVHFFDLKVNND